MYGWKQKAYFEAQKQKENKTSESSHSQNEFL